MPDNSSIQYKLLEEMLLKQLDYMIKDQSKNQAEKTILELFKSTILKKYKDSYDLEILQGEVKKEILDKCIDFVFTDVCLIIRQIKDIDDAAKDAEIERGRQKLPIIKATVTQMLKERGVEIT